MSRLPTITAYRLVKALLKAGFMQEHQRGSHLSLYHPKTVSPDRGADACG